MSLSTGGVQTGLLTLTLIKRNLRTRKPQWDWKKGITANNDTAVSNHPRHPHPFTPEAFWVTYREQEDIFQCKVRWGWDIISDSQFKRLFSWFLTLSISDKSPLCCVHIITLTLDTCCFKWCLKVSYAVGQWFLPVSEHLCAVPWFYDLFCSPFVLSQRESKVRGSDSNPN